MRSLFLLPRFFTLWLTLCLTFPNPAGASPELSRRPLRQLNAGAEESPIREELESFFRSGQDASTEFSLGGHLEGDAKVRQRLIGGGKAFPSRVAAGTEEPKQIEASPKAITAFRQSPNLLVEIYRLGSLDGFSVETDTADRLQDVFGRMNFVYEFKTNDGTHRLIKPDELKPPLQATGLLNYTLAIDFSMDKVAQFFTDAGQGGQR